MAQRKSIKRQQQQPVRNLIHSFFIKSTILVLGAQKVTFSYIVGPYEGFFLRSSQSFPKKLFRAYYALFIFSLLGSCEICQFWQKGQRKLHPAVAMEND